MLHALSGIGAASETFLTDRMVELERLGWEGWAAARWLEDEGRGIAFPPPARIFLPRRRDLWFRRAEVVLGRRPRGDLRGWWFDRAIDAARPMLVHAHFGWTAIWALPAARRHGLPLVVGFHGYDALVYPRFGFGASDGVPDRTLPSGVYDEVFAGASAILANSRFLAERLAELGCKREAVVIPSGIRLERFPFRGPRDEQADYRLVFIGRLVPYKGLDVALRALATVSDRIPTTTLDVVGDGPTRAANEALAAELGLPVHFHGAQPHEVVAKLLRECDVLVFPSRSTEVGQAEALGNVAKEALAIGLPVAASAHGGIPETIPPQLRGDLVPENDDAALADLLIALWQDRGSWATRAALGRRWIEAEFDWRRLAPRIAAVYEDAVRRA